MTKTMDALQCKAEFFAVLDEVAGTQLRIIVTRDGQPVAEIVPFVDKPKTIRGPLKGSVTTMGDLDEPDCDDWEVLKE